jgi:ABC-type sugar transport system ATPase subunit
MPTGTCRNGKERADSPSAGRTAEFECRKPFRGQEAMAAHATATFARRGWIRVAGVVPDRRRQPPRATGSRLHNRSQSGAAVSESPPRPLKQHRSHRPPRREGCRKSAREFLLYLGRLKGLSGTDLDRRVRDLLELVNLHHAADRQLGSYSGGMRQRVGIAQALLGNPRLVIVDEPTVGLDPEERVRFRNLLSEIAHGRVVILSTHIVSDVEAIAGKIAIIRRGRLVAFATPEELLRKAEGRVFTAVVGSEQLVNVQKTVSVSNMVRRADGVHGTCRSRTRRSSTSAAWARRIRARRCSSPSRSSSNADGASTSAATQADGLK